MSFTITTTFHPHTNSDQVEIGTVNALTRSRAVRLAREELMWESTVRVALVNDETGEVLLDEPGSFVRARGWGV